MVCPMNDPMPTVDESAREEAQLVPADSPPLPQRIGRYRIERVLGRGGRRDARRVDGAARPAPAGVTLALRAGPEGIDRPLDAVPLDRRRPAGGELRPRVTGLA